jgi:hypothetical protein
MKHPNREEWMSFLYDELESEPRQALEGHLKECPACSASLAQWRDTTRQLSAYKIAAGSRQVRRSWAGPTLAAAAAAVVLFAGFAWGRSSGISREELEAVKRDATAQALAAGRVEAQKQLEQFATTFGERLDTLQSQHARDYGTLRAELETVAVLTEAGFRQTENRLVALADTAPTPPIHNTP